jgi:hypothetical protein
MAVWTSHEASSKHDIVLIRTSPPIHTLHHERPKWIAEVGHTHVHDFADGADCRLLCVCLHNNFVGH